MIHNYDINHPDYDEDRVTYEDDSKTVTSDVEEILLKTTTENVNRSRGIFQYRRFNGNLDEDALDERNSEEPLDHHHENFDLNSLVSQHEQNVNTDQANETSRDFDPRYRNEHHQVQQRAVHNGSSSSRRDPFISHQVKAIHGTHHKGDGGESASASKTRKDVADDRPDHWKRQQVQGKSGASLKRKAAVAEFSVKDRPMKTAVTARESLRAPAGAQRLVTGMPATRAPLQNLQSVSFQPGWMLPHEGGAQCSGSGRSGRRLSNNETICEDFAEEDANSMRRGAVAVSDRHTQQQYSLQYSQGGAVDHEQHSTSMDMSMGSPLPPHRSSWGCATPAGAASGGKSGHPYSASRARPGSLKARFQKVLRDADASENRIVSVPRPSFAHSGCADLQDPRGRASRYVDMEVDALLGAGESGASYSPFLKAKLLVLNVWTRPVSKQFVTTAACGVASSQQERHDQLDSSTSSRIQSVADRDATLATNDSPHGDADSLELIGAPQEGHEQEGVHSAVLTVPTGGDYQQALSAAAAAAAAVVDVCESLFPVGSYCLAYFKSSSCLGSGRALRRGLSLRIYDPLALPPTAAGERRVICTQSWEPITGDLR